MFELPPTASPHTMAIRPPLQLLQSDAAVIVTLPLCALWLAFFLPYRDMGHLSHAHQSMLCFYVSSIVAVKGATNMPPAASPTGRDAPLC
jgi:hypothetical protein